MIQQLYTPFRHWSDNGSVWLISDTHFDDPDTLAMDQEWIAPAKQIEIINKFVYPTDTFICLGDVGNPEWVKKLRCKYKVLLLGNHDKKHRYEDVFNEIYAGPIFISDRILLSHEPINGLPWCLNIHGHDHNCREVFDEGCEHINLAANVCNYTPVNLKEIITGGKLAKINSIHRETINRAVAGKEGEIKT